MPDTFQPCYLKLGDLLADGAQFVSSTEDSIILSRPYGSGWVGERRYLSKFPDGSSHDVTVERRMNSCSVCNTPVAPGFMMHILCQSSNRLETDEAYDVLGLAGGVKIPSAVMGRRFGPWHSSLARIEFTVFDLETTGLKQESDRMVELGAIRFGINGEIARMSTMIDPECMIPETTTRLTGITDEMVSGAPREAEVVKAFRDFSRGSVLVAHNAPFDLGFMSAAADRAGVVFENERALDTLQMARGKQGSPETALIIRSEVDNYKLVTLGKHFGWEHENAHRAIADVQVTVYLLDELLKRKWARQLKETK